MQLEIEEDDPFEEDLKEFKKFKLKFFTILQWLSLVLIVVALICSLVIEDLRKKAIWDMK